MKHHRLTGQLLGMVFFGEGHVNVLLFAGGHAHHLLFKAGNEGAGAQNQVKSLALTTFKGYAVFKALKINVGCIALLRRPLHRLPAGHILGHSVQLGLHLFVGHGGGNLLHLQALVLAQGYLGIEVRLQNDGGSAVIGNVHMQKAGAAHCLQLLLHNSCLVDLRENLLQTIFVEHVGAVNGLNQLAGGLTLAEARQLNVFTGLQVSFVGAGIHQILLDLHGNLGLGAFLLNALYVHVICPPISGRSGSHPDLQILKAPWWYPSYSNKWAADCPPFSCISSEIIFAGRKFR